MRNGVYRVGEGLRVGFAGQKLHTYSFDDKGVNGGGVGCAGFLGDFLT